MCYSQLQTVAYIFFAIILARLIIEFSKMMIHVFMRTKQPPIATAHVVLTIVANIFLRQIGIEIFAIQFRIRMNNYICQPARRRFHHLIFQLEMTDSCILTFSTLHDSHLSSDFRIGKIHNIITFPLSNRSHSSSA